MHTLGPALLQLFIMYVAARVFGAVASKLRQPLVVGELIGGIAIAPLLVWLNGGSQVMDIIRDCGDHLAEGLRDLPLPQAEKVIRADLVLSARQFLAQLGAIVLLFHVGLETRFDAIRRVGLISFFVATGGIVLPFVCGLGVMWAWHYPHMEAAFMGAAMVATSVGVTARVLTELGVLQSTESRVIISAAVIDDVQGLLVLSIVSGLAAGSISAGGIVTVLAIAFGFVAFFGGVGPYLVDRYRLVLHRIPLENAALMAALACCLGLAALAAEIGLAAIVGAFLAGMMFAEVNEEHELYPKVHSIYEFLVPLFFVHMGTQVDLKAFTDPSLIVLGLVIIVLAVLGKLIGCGLGAWKLGFRSAKLIGVGMVPRGEVGLIVASVGLGLGIVDPKVFSIAVEMSLVTTLLAPALLKAIWPKEPAPEVAKG
jgi:Kef-type K+ transport system membrane component KefB